MKREAIIEVAEQLFAEKGYEGASLRELSARAGINVAMVSYYFGSKEDLFKAIIELRTGEARTYAEALNRDTSLDPLSRLELYIDHYIEQRGENRNFYRIIQRELSLEQRTEMRDFLTQSLSRNKEEFRKIIREGQRQGVFAEVDIDMTIATMIGLVSLVMNSDSFTAKMFHGESSARAEKKMKERLAQHIKSVLRAFLLATDEVPRLGKRG